MELQYKAVEFAGTGNYREIWWVGKVTGSQCLDMRATRAGANIIARLR